MKTKDTQNLNYTTRLTLRIKKNYLQTMQKMYYIKV